ncbi:hypothetical protein BDV96DRAFT_606864 [Lophiotrema nucula]|uniref:Uncharacterized protein n=1 Tax=Lophiotrema nucula TaxID=690887 RepID=A0A6A5YK06_9PLEO|nr:hypothetical protein BDV96DRAFT_606864 [Lophiotrema nucula]
MRRRRRTDYLVITIFLLISGFYIGSVFSSVDQSRRYRQFIALRNASVATVSGAPPSDSPPFRVQLALQQILLHPPWIPNPQVLPWYPTPRPTTTIVPNRSQSPASELIKETPKPEEPEKPKEKEKEKEEEKRPATEVPTSTMQQNASAPVLSYLPINGTNSTNATNSTRPIR